MQWSEDRQLTWDDFQGTPDAGDSFVASTNSGISFSFSYQTRNGKMKLKYEVLCNFYPELSWYRPTMVSSYILKHEQTHFDISELFARKLRKAMAETQFSTQPKEEVNALYNDIERQRREMQQLFDLESDHSKNEEAELHWRKFVANELMKYDAYK